jgi:glucokinase
VLRAAILAAVEDPARFAESLLGNLIDRPTELTSELVANAFLNGDAWTRALVIDSVTHLGEAMAAIHLTVGVEDFILAGGFARALGDPYIREIRTAIANAMWNLDYDWTTMVRFGHQDDDDGLIGVAAEALRRFSEA